MFKRTKFTFGLGLIAVFSMLALSACMPVATAEGAEAEPANPITSFLPIILLVVVFYFILIRPQNKKNKQTTEMRNALKRGDRVTTIGGFKGRVVKIKDEIVTIEIGADKVKLDIERWGISKIEEAAPESKTGKKEEQIEEGEAEEQTKRKPKKLTAVAKKEEKETEDEPADLDAPEEPEEPEDEEEYNDEEYEDDDK